MALRVLLISAGAEIEEMLADDPGAEAYRLERRPPHLIDPGEVARDFGAVLIDFSTTPDAVTLGRAIRGAKRELEWVPICNGETERLAVDALKHGAFDYLVWPPAEPSDLWSIVARAVKKASPPPPPPLPRMFGKYKLTRKLGEGGMAEIFLAQQPGGQGQPPREVVVKRMHDNLVAAGEEFIKMFADEARISSLLVHPNVVRVHDFGRNEDGLYLAMEYIPGRNLEELFLEVGGPLPPAIACYVVAEICAALGHAHSKVDKQGKPLNIVHRDVNPPNVLIADDGRVMLTDFGIAKATQRYYETNSGVLKGKFEYMSPEQANGKSVDRRTDLFCAGLVLYELLCGVRPFQSQTPIETLFRIQQCTPELPSKWNPRLPQVLDKMVMMALAKDPEARYQEAGEFERHLREFARRTTNPGPRDLAMFAKGASRQQKLREREDSSSYPAATAAADAVAPAAAPADESTAPEAKQQRAAPSPARAPAPRAAAPPPALGPTADGVPAPRSKTPMPASRFVTSVHVDDEEDGGDSGAIPETTHTESSPERTVPSPERTVPSPESTVSAEMPIRPPPPPPPPRERPSNPSRDRVNPIERNSGPRVGAIGGGGAVEGPATPIVNVGDGAIRSGLKPALALPEVASDRPAENLEDTVIREDAPIRVVSAPPPGDETRKPLSTNSVELFPAGQAAESTRRRWQIGAIVGGAALLVTVAVVLGIVLGTGPAKGKPAHTPLAAATTPAATPVISTAAVTATLAPTHPPATTALAVATATAAPVMSVHIATPTPTARATIIAIRATPHTPTPTPVAMVSSTPVAMAGKGMLNVMVNGWANVYVDGVKLARPAPLYQEPISAGRHHVVVEEPDHKTEYDILIVPGKVTPISTTP